VLPPELEGLKFGAVHGASPQGPFFRIFMYGRIRDIAHLKRVVVKRLPDETLLDSADGSGKGKLVIKHDKPGYDTFVVERVVPTLPDDGVVSLRIELDDGTAPEGWFISHKLASSTTPEIRSPLSSASISDVHPLVSWVPFHSPEYMPFEWRTLSVYVSSETTKDTAWDFWTKDYGDLAAVHIGDHAPAAKTSLIPGDYWLNVTCSEGRMFGPIAITRDARTVGPFHLVP
jgi:hypothetical protein